MCCCSCVHIYIRIFADRLACIFTYIHIFPLSVVEKGETKQESVTRKEWMKRGWEMDCNNQNFFFS